MVPSSLGEGGEAAIPDAVKSILEETSFLLVENERSARRFLRKIGWRKSFDEAVMKIMDEKFLIESAH